MNIAINCLRNHLIKIDQHINGLLSYSPRNGKNKVYMDQLEIQLRQMYLDRDEILEAIEILEKYKK